MPRPTILDYVGSTYMYCLFIVALTWVEKQKATACEASDSQDVACLCAILSHLGERGD